jgi:hypothetical protein
MKVGNRRGCLTRRNKPGVDAAPIRPIFRAGDGRFRKLTAVMARKVALH